MDMSKGLQDDGYYIVRNVLTANQIAELREGIEPLLKACPTAGIRSLAHKAPCVRRLSESPCVRELVEPVVGSGAQLIRSILFNKNQEANWQVAWHQDVTIAVRDQAQINGYTAWTLKDGIIHVQPPVAVLEQILTVRLHLDPADESNGALWVSPGSHRLGRLPNEEAVSVAERQGKHLCAVQAGDALVFRPLLLHASRKAVSDSPRRVLHLEFSNAMLPAPLAWHEAA